MELIALTAKSRETSGKGAARKLRKNNEFPGIVYGGKTDPMKLSIKTSEFVQIIREHGTTGLFFNLNIDEGSVKEKIVMLKDMQLDVFGLNYLHVDLHEIDMDTNVTVSVPIETIGESKGVKLGGMLQIIRRELDVVCKPADTPDAVQIDIADLDVGDSVHVEDIDLGDSVEIPHDVNFTVITVVPPVVEEEEVTDEEDLMEEGEMETAAAAEESPEE